MSEGQRCCGSTRRVSHAVCHLQHTRIVYLIISVVGAIIFSLYLLYDLQMLMGGKTQELSPDEYIFASMTIYLDVIQIFLNILQALQASDN